MEMEMPKEEMKVTSTRLIKSMISCSTTITSSVPQNSSSSLNPLSKPSSTTSAHTFKQRTNKYLQRKC